MQSECIGNSCSDGGSSEASTHEGGSGELGLSPDRGAPPDTYPPCPGGVRCGAQYQLCCASGQICYGDKCIKPGKTCSLHSDCPYGYFCDPVVKVCILHTQAYCQYKPTVGVFSPKTEWSWSTPTTMSNYYDVLAPPVVVQLTDDNKDGVLGSGDVPDLVFVSYPDVDNHPVSIYLDGVLRAVSGDTGKELWAATGASQRLVAGASVATGDINADGQPEIVAVDASFYVKAFDRKGKLLWTSDAKVASSQASSAKWAGWGGGIAIADLDIDGKPEIFFDTTVFDGTGKLRWQKIDGGCGAPTCNFGPLTTAANLDKDAKGTLELVVGHRVYSHDGTLLWTQTAAGDGYTAVADMDLDLAPEVVLISKGKLYYLDGKTGKVEWGPVSFPYPASGDPTKAGPGGPPTVADFDGDKNPEVGVAGGYYYVVFDHDCASGAAKTKCASGTTDGILWKVSTKDLSSRATGSSVFDFEADGKAEVVYSDECFLRVYDGTTGKVLFYWSNNTRTATEAPIVADVDGDGRAEIVMVSNRRVWTCWQYSTWVKPPGWSSSTDPGYHGITVLGDKKDNWVGTRLIWNQHAYHVSNVCDGNDQVCSSSQNKHGRIPSPEKDSWSLSWLNSYRQNVQGFGIFNAPDLVVGGIKVNMGGCPKKMTVTFTVTNKGSALVGAGLKTTLYFGDPAKGGTALKTVPTTKALKPNESETFTTDVTLPGSFKSGTFSLYVVVDDTGSGQGERNECKESNNSSKVQATCKPPA